MTMIARSPLRPDIPALAEAGYADPEWHSWYGLAAAAPFLARR